MKTTIPFRLSFVSLLVFLSFTPVHFAVARDQQEKQILPVKKVILYKHGVGYFERQGTVTGQSDVELYFKKDQMNDLLKSLTALDLSGGQVGSIVYDSTKTTVQLLSQYNFKLHDGTGLSHMLRELQGSQIELELIGGNSPVLGTIIGVDSRSIKVDDDTTIKEYDVNLIQSTDQIRRVAVDDIGNFRFIDNKINQDIQDYLAILFQQHRRDQKRLVLRTDEAGQRNLLVSYVTETPVWKATYRVVLPEVEKDKSFLQGWAIVDNVSEEDWDNVQLTLVSGLPISFIQNLYDPWYKKRSVVAVQEEVALAPTTPEVGMSSAKKSKSAPMAMRAAGRADAKEMLVAEAPMPGMMPAEEDFDLAEEMRSLQAETVTREVGDLFQYNIDEPISIAKNRSALIPIVAADVDGEAVALYNENTRRKNPLSAFRLRNSTGLTLEGGPLTIYQAGSYAGEALVETVKADEQRYITYGVDLGTHVNTKHGSKGQGVRRVIINRGVMKMHEYIIETKAYNLDNKDKKEKTAVIEHPFRQDWKLLNEQLPIEITDNYKRFEVKIPAKKLTTFEVKERRDQWHTVSISNITPDDILNYVRQKFIDEASQKQLEKIVAVKTQIVDIDRQLKAIAKEKKDIFDDQKRVRDNLGRLGRSDEEKRLRSRYVEQLNTQEDRLAEMDTTEKTLNTQRLKLQKQLDTMIENLEQDLTL